jgi:hypothetical protein
MHPRYKEQVEERLKSAQEKMTAAVQTIGTGSWGMSWIDPGAASLARSSGLSILGDVYGTSHQHYLDFERATTSDKPAEGFRRAEAILHHLAESLQHDWLRSIRSLLAAEVFSDFLEMAEHLSTEGYKDAAAVISGSSLEAHLKRLAPRAGIDLTYLNSRGDRMPKMAEALNQELTKAGVLDKNEQKQVTAWMGIRNDAAHGSYDKVDASMVRLMIPGVRNFLSRHPA